MPKRRIVEEMYRSIDEESDDGWSSSSEIPKSGVRRSKRLKPIDPNCSVVVTYDHDNIFEILGIDKYNEFDEYSRIFHRRPLSINFGWKSAKRSKKISNKINNSVALPKFRTLKPLVNESLSQNDVTFAQKLFRSQSVYAIYDVDDEDVLFLNKFCRQIPPILFRWIVSILERQFEWTKRLEKVSQSYIGLHEELIALTNKAILLSNARALVQGKCQTESAEKKYLINNLRSIVDFYSKNIGKKCSVSDDLLLLVCSYWTEKRKRFGTSAIRCFQDFMMENWSRDDKCFPLFPSELSNHCTDDHALLNFRIHLDKARLIVDRIRRRERLKRELFNLEFGVANDMRKNYLEKDSHIKVSKWNEIVDLSLLCGLASTGIEHWEKVSSLSVMSLFSISDITKHFYELLATRMHSEKDRFKKCNTPMKLIPGAPIKGSLELFLHYYFSQVSLDCIWFQICLVSALKRKQTFKNEFVHHSSFSLPPDLLLPKQFSCNSWDVLLASVLEKGKYMDFLLPSIFSSFNYQKFFDVQSNVEKFLCQHCLLSGHNNKKEYSTSFCQARAGRKRVVNNSEYMHARRLSREVDSSNIILHKRPRLLVDRNSVP